MRKLAPIAMLALLAVAFTSCKKDYTCSCTNSAGAASGTYTFPKAKKSDAKKACDAWHSIASAGGGKCTLN